MYSMRVAPIDCVLVSFALALLCAVPGNALAGPVLDQAAIEAAIPVPEPANVPPPTAADIGIVAPEAGSTAEAGNAANAVPTTADVVSPVRADTAPASTPGNPETVDVKSLTGKDLVKAPTAGGMEAADVAVAEKLRDLLANRLGKFISRDDDRAAVEAFYRDRGFAPLWTTGGAPNARASAATAYLRKVATDGLDPDDYPVPDFAGASDPEARARADVTLTDSVLTFARHARTGRVHFTRVSAAISYQLQYPDPAEVLSRVAASDNSGETLGSYNPQQPGYKALKAKLAEAQGENRRTGSDRSRSRGSDAAPRDGGQPRPGLAHTAEHDGRCG